MKTSLSLKHLLPTVVFLLLSASAVNAVAAATYEFISRSTDGTQTGYGQRPQVTPDGRFVVYVSSESTLVTPNAPGYQIYLYDRTFHTTELISMSNNGAYGNSSSDYPTISNDGCRVVFESYSTNLVAGVIGNENIFVRDRCIYPQQTRLVSANASGNPGNGQSTDSRISGNGRYVAFMTYATNIGNSSGAVVRKKLDTGAIDLVSVKADSSLGSGNKPDISYDGSRIVFWSYLFNDSLTNWDIYLWDELSASVSRVSTGSSGELQVSPLGSISGIHSPGISGNGRYVAFVTGFDTGTPSLTPEGGNGYYQVYVKDTQTGALALASVSSSGALGNDSSGEPYERPALSHNGKHVAFFSKATNLVTSTAWIKPLVRDLVANQTILVADRSIAGYSLALSNDDLGRFVVFSSNQTTLDPKFPNTQGVYLANLLPHINNLLQDPSFEMGTATPWTQYSTAGTSYLVFQTRPHLGIYSAYLADYGSQATEAIEQSMIIPANAQTATVEFWSFISTLETTTNLKNDTFTVDLYDATGINKLATLTTLSNLDATDQWVLKSFPVSVAAYKGQTVRLRFTATENASLNTAFFIDDVSMTTAKSNIFLLLPTLRTGRYQ